MRTLLLVCVLGFFFLGFGQDLSLTTEDSTLELVGPTTIYLNKANNHLTHTILTKLSIKVGDLGLIASVEVLGTTLRPEDTDSLYIMGKMGYPSPYLDVWLFPHNKGTLQLFSAHPKDARLGSMLRLDNLASFHRFPFGIYVMEKPHYGGLYDLSHYVALALAPTPRLYAEYPYNSIECLIHLVRQRTYFPHPTKRQISIAKQTDQLLASITKEIKIGEVQRLLQSDSANIIAVAARAIYLIQHKEPRSATPYIHQMEALSRRGDQEYLTSYVRGLYFEEQQQYAKAQECFQKTLDITLTPSNIRLSSLRKKRTMGYRMRVANNSTKRH